MSTLHLLVCPHDTANNPDRWYRLAQYLSQKLEAHITFDISLDFADFHANLNQADIVYANPSDTLMLIEQHGFAALLHPANVYDEAVIVASNEVANPSIESLNGQTVASVECILATKIGLHYLASHGIKPAAIQNYESWTAVISGIWRGESQYGFIYKDTYDELSEQGKSMVSVFATTNEQVAFHNIVVGRNALALKDALTQTMAAMPTDEKGQEVLAELHFEQWVPTTQEQLDAIKRIQETY
jgi:phosphonate transport system substrate-binding protein